MEKNKITAWLSVLFVVGLVFLSPMATNSAFAAQQTVEADGYYTVGDGAEENFSVARERAKQDALGRAAEMAAVYVEKFTAVKNHQLTASEIKTLAAKVLNVLDAVFENTTEGNVFKIRCHVVARVEDEGAFASLLSDREKLEESLQREREKDEQIAKLNRQMEELKRQYQTAKTDSERTEIRRQAQANDASFTAAQWVERGIRKLDKARKMKTNKSEYDEIIECFNKAIALQPDNAFAYYNLGKAYMTMGRDSTVTSTEVGKQPGDFWRKAIEYYTKAIELKPDYYDAYLALGCTYPWEGGKVEQAIECFTKLIELKPDDAYSYTPLGALYERLRKYREAIECFTKAIELKPYLPDFYFRRGKLYESLGNRKAAKQDYAKAYEIKPYESNYKWRIVKLSATILNDTPQMVFCSQDTFLDVC